MEMGSRTTLRSMSGSIISGGAYLNGRENYHRRHGRGAYLASLRYAYLMHILVVLP